MWFLGTWTLKYPKSGYSNKVYPWFEYLMPTLIKWNLYQAQFNGVKSWIFIILIFEKKRLSRLLKVHKPLRAAWVKSVVTLIKLCSYFCLYSRQYFVLHLWKDEMCRNGVKIKDWNFRSLDVPSWYINCGLVFICEKCKSIDLNILIPNKWCYHRIKLNWNLERCLWYASSIHTVWTEWLWTLARKSKQHIQYSWHNTI